MAILHRKTSAADMDRRRRVCDGVAPIPGRNSHEPR
jgi:hypothetical protein